MKRDHGAAGGAVIDKYARLDGFPAHDHVFTRCYQGQASRAQGASGSVKVNVVRHGAGLGVDQRQFHIIAFMYDNQRTRNGAIECQRPHLGAIRCNIHQLLDGFHADLDYLWSALGHLVVLGHKGRRHQFLGHHR